MKNLLRNLKDKPNLKQNLRWLIPGIILEISVAIEVYDDVFVNAIEHSNILNALHVLQWL